MTARERADQRWGLAPPRPEHIVLKHKQGCHGRKRYAKTCGCPVWYVIAPEVKP